MEKNRSIITLCAYQDRRKDIIENKERKREGKSNCMPLPFKRFSAYLPGWMKYMYYIFTANSKVGKTKLVDFLFVYTPIFERMKRGSNIKTHVLYFSLEAATAEKEFDFYCNLLYNLDRFRFDPWMLESMDKELPDYVLEMLDSERYQRYIEEYEKTVEYIHDIKNPTGIWKYCMAYAYANGTANKVKGKQYDDVTGEYYDGEILDKSNPLTWNDPEQYNIIIIDNFANLTEERGWNKQQTVTKMSKYCIDLSKLGFVVVAIQHQAQAQESLENQKNNKVAPGLEGLGDDKSTQRDANFVIGLFTPSRYGITQYKGYDILKFQDNIRFMSVLAGRNIKVNGSLTVPLSFRGDVNQFEELPPADNDREINAVLNQLKMEEQQIINYKKDK